MNCCDCVVFGCNLETSLPVVVILIPGDSLNDCMWDKFCLKAMSSSDSIKYLFAETRLLSTSFLDEISSLFTFSFLLELKKLASIRFSRSTDRSRLGVGDSYMFLAEIEFNYWWSSFNFSVDYDLKIEGLCIISLGISNCCTEERTIKLALDWTLERPTDMKLSSLSRTELPERSFLSTVFSCLSF